MSANDTQIGGNHYQCQKGYEQHWDRAWRLNYDPFQYIITKWVERHREKGGLQDLQKAQHALEKYIELMYPHGGVVPQGEQEVNSGECTNFGYVDQDR